MCGVVSYNGSFLFHRASPYLVLLLYGIKEKYTSAGAYSLASMMPCLWGRVSFMSAVL